jgi:hypothetical protein
MLTLMVVVRLHNSRSGLDTALVCLHIFFHGPSQALILATALDHLGSDMPASL